MKRIFYGASLFANVSFCFGVLPPLTDSIILQFSRWTPQQREKFNQTNQGLYSRQVALEDKAYHYLDLSHLKLYNVSFDNTYFNGVNLQGSDLKGCSFRRASFKNTNLKEANLIGINLEECCFKGAFLQKAILTPTLQLPDYQFPADIIKFYASLPDSEDKKILNQLIGTGSFDLRLQHLENLDLTGINFKNCDLTCAYLQNTNLTEALFENTTLRGAKLSQVKLSNNFTLPQESSSLDLIKLYAKETTTPTEKVLLNKILGSGFVYLGQENTERDLRGLNLRDINLSRGVLEYVKLSGADLQNAILTGSKFRECLLSETILPNGSKAPKYQRPEELIIRYSESQDEDKKNLNYIFELMPLEIINGNLDGLNLSKINFENFIFSYTSLENTDLQEANLTHTRFLDDISLKQATLPNGYQVPNYKSGSELVRMYCDSKDRKERENLNQLFDFIDCLNLSSQDLSGLDLSGIHLAGAEVYQTDFRNSILTDADLGLDHKIYVGDHSSPYSLLVGATLWEGFTFPQHEKLEELILNYSDSKDPQEKENLNKLFGTFKIWMDKADFKNCNLSNINLKGARLFEVDLTGADLTDAILDNAILRDSNLGGVRLSKDLILPPNVSLQQILEMYADPTTSQKHKDLLNKIIPCHLLNDKLNFNELDLTGVDLSGVDLTEHSARMSKCFKNSIIRKVQMFEKITGKIIAIPEYQYKKDLIDFAKHSPRNIRDFIFYMQLNK